MQRVVWWLIVFAGLAGLALILYNAIGPPEQEIVVRRPPPAEPPPRPLPVEPEVRHPVPQMPAEKPLPALDTSDATMRNSLADLLPDSALIKLPVLKDFVRRVVATIDNLPRRVAAPRLWPLKPTPGQFKVSGGDEHPIIAADNSARYAVYVRLAEAIDSAKLAAVYFHYYPLFQQAYRDLGYPKGRFNDRLVQVIDHLLETPELDGPVALVRPKVFYLYADPDLESRSAGQKILMRAGAENARRVKAKLREIRREIAAGIDKSKEAQTTQ
jgi:hypothetical protein